ncbi:RluA family pseudouridine synthase, partial [bacterium]|nr:RluA family pseudouridine synthase [bacterium]
MPNPPSDGQRLDAYCAEALGQSRSWVVSRIKSGLITVNGKVEKPATRLASNDSVDFSAVVLAVEPEISIETPDELPVMFYEDQDVMVINKPAGITVHPIDTRHKGYFLTTWLKQVCPQIVGVGEPLRPGIVHRLDQMTDGLMVIAKSRLAYDALKQQFHDRLVTKAYYALVKGDVIWTELTINQPIIRNPKNRHKMMVAANGRPALSVAKTVHRYGSSTLVEVSPKTGRTHQIRVHMEFVGHPVVGDPLYGKESAKRTGQRLQAY